MTKDEIIKLSDKELNVEAAKATGNPVVDIDEKKQFEYQGESERLEIEQEIRRQLLGKVPSGGFAKWHDGTLAQIHKKGEGFSSVLPWNPSCGIITALELWEQLPEQKEILWKDGAVDIYWDRFDWTGLDFDCHIKGKPEDLPRLLTQAFVIYKEQQC